jgi:hypothetical protein
LLLYYSLFYYLATHHSHIRSSYAGPAAAAAPAPAAGRRVSFSQPSALRASSFGNTTGTDDDDETTNDASDGESVGTIDTHEDPNEEEEDLEEEVAMMTGMSVSKEMGKIVLPYRVVAYIDSDLFKYVRIDVWLLSGTTMNGIIYGVDKSGWYFEIKYLYPAIWLTPDILDFQDTHEWDHGATDLRTLLTTNINQLKEGCDNDNVYGMQRIKLPYRCEPQLSESYGAKAFVKMYEHDDANFAKAKQRYYILHANLNAVEKPKEVNTYVAFSKARSPVKSGPVDDPFDAPSSPDNTSS